VLGKLGIVDHVEPDHATRVEGAWRRAATPRTRPGGLVEPAVPVGATFSRGALLARLVALTGEVVEEVRAPDDGLLVSWVEPTWVSPGGLLGTLGIPDGERL
jgi:predicted deacylase